MLNLQHLQSFVAVIDEGSFHAAARALGCSQPAVTQHLRKLEEACGRRLVDRRPGHALPTRHGARLLPLARRLLRASDRALRLFETEALVVGASSNIGTYLLQPFVKSFAARRRETGPVTLAIGPNPEIAERLSAGEVDMAAMEWWDGRPGFEAVLWRREPLVAIAPPDHPWAALSAVQAAALLALPLIGGEAGTGTGRLLAALARDLGTVPQESMRLGSTEAVKQAVKAGLGVSIVLAGAVAEEMRAGTLCARPIAGTDLAKDLFLVLPEDAPIDGPAARFAGHLLTGGG